MIRASRAALGFLLAGCSWQQGALQPRAPKALAIARLGDFFFWIELVVWCAVVGAAIWAFSRAARRDRRGDEPLAAPSDSQQEHKLSRAVGASTVVSLLLLAVMLVASIATGRSLSDFGASPPVRIKVTAHQWWWTIEYLGRSPDERVVTANELYLPAGQPVELELTSADVIHSFWIPNLDGKHDLIPSHVVKTRMVAEKPGVYSGRCAEFCGYQHAHMDLLAVAVTPTQFEAWLAGQRQPGAEPRTETQRRGRELVEGEPCALCHNIAGTRALGGVGPDLTHFASRATLAAGSAPNDREALARWLRAPAALKPGAQMPAVPLSAADLA
ncbi:MAG TPA: c-type cytochrome, partial [Polyangiaceae bacterium]|nr:c-type cytochrome [Polyangiaceae bacterium]